MTPVTPLDVADSPDLWLRYRDHLKALGVVGDRLEARALPGTGTSMAWAHHNTWPDGVPIERIGFVDALDRLLAEQHERQAGINGRTPLQPPEEVEPTAEQLKAQQTARRSLAAASWPDYGLDAMDPEEWRTDEWADDDPRRAASDNRMLRASVGIFLVLRILQAARLINRSGDDVFDYLAFSLRLDHGLTAEDLECLLSGHLALDAATLLAIIEALHLTFDGQWKQEPAALLDAVERTLRLEQVIERARELPSDDLTRVLAECRPTTAASLDAKRSPRAFQDDLDRPYQPLHGRSRDGNACKPPQPRSRYRPLYEELVDNPHPTPTYTFSDVSDLIGPDRAGKTGLPTSARRAEHRSWWSNGTSKDRGHVRAWQAAGYKVETGSLVFVLNDEGEPDLQGSKVTFVEKPGREVWHRYRHDLRSYRPPLATVENENLDEFRGAAALHLRTKVPLAPHFEALNRVRATSTSAVADDAGPDS